MRALTSAIVGSVLAASIAVAQGSPPGVSHYTRVDATVACGGATTADAWPELKKEGFAAVINLRQAGEPGADVDAAARSAEAAGLRYVHIPFSTSEPRASAVDAFLAALRDPVNSPVYIHCASANRVGAMWLVKRMLVDHWDEQKALTEAHAIGLRSANLRDFALDYVRQHQGR